MTLECAAVAPRPVCAAAAFAESFIGRLLGDENFVSFRHSPGRLTGGKCGTLTNSFSG